MSTRVPIKLSWLLNARKLKTFFKNELDITFKMIANEIHAYRNNTPRLILRSKAFIRTIDKKPFKCTTFILTVHCNELRLLMGHGIPPTLNIKVMRLTKQHKVPILKSLNVTQCGADSNPTPPRQQASRHVTNAAG